jgi:hypothetical protein
MSHCKHMADVPSPWSSYAQGCSPHHLLRDARLTRHFCPPPFNASSGTTASACATPCGKWGSRGVLHYAPHIRPQPVNQPNELVSAACFMNDSSAASCCFGGCSGHGRCSRGLCVCAPGWRGLDCAEYASTTDGASSIDSGCAAPGFVYVFDRLPSDWSTWHAGNTSAPCTTTSRTFCASCSPPSAYAPPTLLAHAYSTFLPLLTLCGVTWPTTFMINGPWAASPRGCTTSRPSVACCTPRTTVAWPLHCRA